MNESEASRKRGSVYLYNAQLNELMIRVDIKETE